MFRCYKILLYFRSLSFHSFVENVIYNIVNARYLFCFPSYFVVKHLNIDEYDDLFAAISPNHNIHTILDTIK